MLCEPNSRDHFSASRISRSERAIATTRAPFASRARTKVRPKKPDAPVRTIVFPATENSSLLFNSAEARGNYDLHQSQDSLPSCTRMRLNKGKELLPGTHPGWPYAPSG